MLDEGQLHASSTLPSRIEQPDRSGWDFEWAQNQSVRSEHFNIILKTQSDVKILLLVYEVYIVNIQRLIFQVLTAV